MIQSGIKTPDTYIDINLQAQRTGLPANIHKVLFVTDDATTDPMKTPIAVYDKATANVIFGDNSKTGRMITAAIKTNRVVDAEAINITTDIDTTADLLEPLGHTIIAVADAPLTPEEAEAWVDHIEFVSSAIEQRPVILVVPFSDVQKAEVFSQYAPVKTNYRIVAACYNGGIGQEAEISACMAAALANSNDPALPFNDVNLPGLTAVSDQYKLTFERKEAAMRKGVCIIETGADGTPEIIRALSTYQANPETGDPDDIVADINGALVLDYTRKVVRQAIRQNGRRKNTERERKNLRTLILVQLLKLDDAEILQNVHERSKELTVVEDTKDRTRANVKIPADWVRGMHIIAGQLDIY